jgi:hypothetical protein
MLGIWSKHEHDQQQIKINARNKLGQTIEDGTMQMEMKCSNNKDDEKNCKWNIVMQIHYYNVFGHMVRWCPWR